MAKNNSQWSVKNIFKSNSISTTNPADDIADLLNVSRNSIRGNHTALDEVGMDDLNNITRIITQLRNDESVRDDMYPEYRNMNNDVIIQGALKCYSDDATVIDNIRAVPIWINSENDKLVGELTTFVESLNVYGKVWGWIYQTAQYGDKYLENIFNSKGYLTGVRDYKFPEYIYDIHEDDERQGYIVKRDPRLRKYSTNGMYADIDLYGPGKFTHMYLSDNPEIETMIIDINGKDGTMDYIEVDVLRGTSAIESVRTNYRILRLLEDTIITNKVARSEYIRLFNVEVGDADGKGSNQVMRRFKRMFDSKPRFDGANGEYSSSRPYRPSADAVFNAVHNGQGAVDIKELGGDVETRWMNDVEYFKDKMFTGLQIPKSYLGFDQSLGGLDGGSTLARLDIRYARTVRRIQGSIIRGITDLCDLWLASRGRYNEIETYEVLMQNPSSAEEMSRLEELTSRLTIINNIAESINNVAEGLTNLPKLYYELVQEFIDVPAIKDIFEELLDKAIVIKHIEVNTQLTKARGESVVTYKDMATAIDSLSQPNLPTEGSEDDFDFSSDDEGSGGFDDLEDIDTNSGGGSLPLTDDTVPDNEMELGSLGDELGTDEDIDTPSGSTNELLDSYRPVVTSKVLESFKVESTKTELLSDMIQLSITAPTKEYKRTAEKLSERLSTDGFTKENIQLCYDLMSDINRYQTNKGMTTTKLLRVTDSLTSNNAEEVNSTLEVLIDESVDTPVKSRVVESNSTINKDFLKEVNSKLDKYNVVVSKAFRQKYAMTYLTGNHAESALLYDDITFKIINNDISVVEDIIDMYTKMSAYREEC